MARSAMDFLKSVSARVGDVAKNVGDLLLDSDSDSEADERSERTRRGGEGADAGGGEGAGSSGDGAGIAGESNFDSDRDGKEDRPLISEDVWTTIRAAKDRVAHAAKSTAASVSRDVAAAAETVRRDLGELKDSIESPDEVFFVGDAASEYAVGGAGGLGVSVESDGDDDDGFGSDGDGSLDPDVAETFERTAEALENVGERVETFGAAVFQNAGRLVDAIVDAFEEEGDEEADAKPPGSLGSPRRRVSRTSRRRDGKETPRSVGARASVAAETPASVFEAKVAAMQRDSSTYCDEPADAVAFAAFARAFDAASDETRRDVDALLKANSFMRAMSGRVAPAVVPHEVFWSRYFFRLRLLERERDAALRLEAGREAGPGAGAAAETRGSTAPAEAGRVGSSRAAAAAEARASARGGAPEPTRGASRRSPSPRASEADAAGEDGEVFPAAGEEEAEVTRAPRTKRDEDVGERVAAAGDEGEDASARGRGRVLSLATDDGTVASDDSLGRDWTRVPDVESPSGFGEVGAEAGAEAGAPVSLPLARSPASPPRTLVAAQ